MGSNWEARDRKLERKRRMKVSGRGLMVDYPNAIRKKAREVNNAKRDKGTEMQ